MISSSGRLRGLQVAAMVVVSTAAGHSALACQVPVFRYALERWEPDLYDAYILHRGGLSPDAQKLVVELRSRILDAGRAGGGSANLQVHVVDLAEGVPAVLTPLEGQFDEFELPTLLLLAPERRGPPVVVLARPLSSELVASLTDSPVRREISKRLLAGDSVVWVLLESGDGAKDDAAYSVLEKSLAVLEKELRLPDLESIVSDAEYNPETRVELKLSFSSLRLPHGDPKEAPLRQMLLSVEPDLPELTADPMAFPIFGRGRALYALVAGGIHEDTIGEACAGLIGPCSCTVKDLNPGVDLLLDVDWNALLVGSAIPERPLPVLPGLAALSGSAGEDDERDELSGQAEDAASDEPIASDAVPSAETRAAVASSEPGESASARSVSAPTSSGEALDAPSSRPVVEGDLSPAETSPPAAASSLPEPEVGVASVRTVPSVPPASEARARASGERTERGTAVPSDTEADGPHSASWARLGILAVLGGIVFMILAAGTIVLLRKRTE